MDVSRPASRVLAVLEMLQNRPGVNGPTIAAELGVDTRTVRRYVATLAEMGIPVAATTGRHGGYRLMPGFRLPPLMFSADEAVGLAVALLATRAASDDLPPVVASAFTKIRRVLPRDLAQQVQALHDVAVFPPQRSAPARGFPDPAVLAALARVCWRTNAAASSTSATMNPRADGSSTRTGLLRCTVAGTCTGTATCDEAAGRSESIASRGHTDSPSGSNRLMASTYRRRSSARSR